MKKLIFVLVLGGSFLATSCQKEDMNAYVAADGYSLKAKIKTTTIEPESEPEDDKCETAFGRYCECASQNSCFSDFGINRWGWSVQLNSWRTYRFNLFAGAGQCELDKGKYVGYVTVTFHSDGSVTYGNAVMESGYNLTEFHFYAGETSVPLNNGNMTVAPGQYYNDGDLNGDGKVYVIVHTSVCADEV